MTRALLYLTLAALSLTLGITCLKLSYPDTHTACRQQGLRFAGGL
jgi:hypothetical protein